MEGETLMSGGDQRHGDEPSASERRQALTALNCSLPAGHKHTHTLTAIDVQKA